MSLGSQNRECIEQCIRKAFSSTRYPGDEFIANRNYAETEETEDAFRGKNWEEIVGDTEFINRNYEALIQFSDEAFVYFLPAYLLDLLDFESSDMTAAAIITIFEPRSDLTYKDCDKRRLDALNDDQVRAIIQYFNYLKVYLESLGEDFWADKCNPIVGGLEKHLSARD